jgi:hypothetical protein
VLPTGGHVAEWSTRLPCVALLMAVAGCETPNGTHAAPGAVPASAVRRQQWKGARDSFRKEWGEEFGEWPKSGDDHWPGHHIRDLQRGGEATAKRNVLPTPPSVHDVFTDEYPICYAGGSRWSMVGPDRPYTD